MIDIRVDSVRTKLLTQISCEHELDILTRVRIRWSFAIVLYLRFCTVLLFTNPMQPLLRQTVVLAERASLMMVFISKDEVFRDWEHCLWT